MAARQPQQQKASFAIDMGSRVDAKLTICSVVAFPLRLPVCYAYTGINVGALAPTDGSLKALVMLRMSMAEKCPLDVGA